jgi:ergothioneine biosynthesis protein EgtB
MKHTMSMKGLAERFVATRATTLGLVEGLSPEDCMIQSMPDASPVKWHLAHTTWFFETFLLEHLESGFRPFNPAFRELFNSYYVAVGPRHARPARGVLSRPSLQEVLDYRHDVDRRLLALLDRELPADVRSRVELGLAHEEQHQELILTDVLHHFSCNPLLPALRAMRPRSADPARGQSLRAEPLRFCTFAGGLVEVGHDAHDPRAGFAFDNESPRHRVWLEPYALAQRPVAQGEFMQFMAEGGYRRPELWLSEGWDQVRSQGWEHPLYWRRAPQERTGAGGWQVFTLNGLQPVEPSAPVSQLSYFEADAYARWAGARLPTEMEWEHAARQELPHTGHVWEWTASAYAPYPGFVPAPSALGEYNGKFMVNQMVLRGGSQATPPGHVRPSYRNFFPASARWQFSGVRLASTP